MKKLYNSLGTITPPPHPTHYLPWGSHFKYIFLWEKGKYVENQKYSCPLYYNWHLFSHVLWKSYFLNLTISISALNFYKEKWVQTKSQTIRWFSTYTFANLRLTNPPYVKNVILGMWIISIIDPFDTTSLQLFLKHFLRYWRFWLKMAHLCQYFLPCLVQHLIRDHSYKLSLKFSIH